MYKALVVDDEKIGRDGIKFLMKKYNDQIEVAEAINGRVALEHIRSNQVDILITDIKMPIMGGMELIREVYKDFPHLKIIILSGYGEFEYAQNALKMGVCEYLLKPVSKDDFDEAIEKVLTKCKQDNTKSNEDVESDNNIGVGKVEAVKKYIAKNYHEDIGVEQLANAVDLTPSYLSHIFKKETGENLGKFIKKVRMEKARDMLENSYEKIVNISEAVGYQNVSYFCKSFREYYGISPQKFRAGDKEELE